METCSSGRGCTRAMHVNLGPHGIQYSKGSRETTKTKLVQERVPKLVKERFD